MRSLCVALHCGAAGWMATFGIATARDYLALSAAGINIR
jgi:hypothetical protein